MKFTKGQSGNPAGKPKGATDKRTALRGMLESRKYDLVEKAIELALNGDVGALRLCIDRIQAPLRARDDTITLDITGATVSDKASSILTAISAGQVTPEQGGRLLDALLACIKIREMDELERRITALETSVSGTTG